MSRDPVKKTLLAFIALLVFPLAASGADRTETAPPQEIVYRVNLGRADDVKLLLEKGLSPDMTDKAGVPLLALASSRKDREGLNVVKALLDAGADINARDGLGQTALFYAARQGNADAVQFLLERNADYYAVDHFGDVARNVAHRQGHTDILQMMDGFVKEQAEKRKKEYEEFNKALEQRYREEDEARRKTAEQAGGQAAPPAAQPAEDEAARAARELSAKEQRQKLVEKRNSDEFRAAMRELTYQHCAFEYWSFCFNARQTSELAPDALEAQIAELKEAIIGTTAEIMKEYALDRRYMDHISNRAKYRIFGALSAMPSKAYRFEHGVCKVADMEKRCGSVADRWNVADPPPPKKKR